MESERVYFYKKGERPDYSFNDSDVDEIIRGYGETIKEEQIGNGNRNIDWEFFGKQMLKVVFYPLTVVGLYKV